MKHIAEMFLLVSLGKKGQPTLGVPGFGNSNNLLVRFVGNETWNGKQNHPTGGCLGNPSRVHSLGFPVRLEQRCTFFPVVYFSRGTHNPQEIGQGALADLGFQFSFPMAKLRSGRRQKKIGTSPPPEIPDWRRLRSFSSSSGVAVAMAEGGGWGAGRFLRSRGD